MLLRENVHFLCLSEYLRYTLYVPKIPVWKSILCEGCLLVKLSGCPRTAVDTHGRLHIWGGGSLIFFNLLWLSLECYISVCEFCKDLFVACWIDSEMGEVSTIVICVHVCLHLYACLGVLVVQEVRASRNSRTDCSFTCQKNLCKKCMCVCFDECHFVV